MSLLTVLTTDNFKACLAYVLIYFGMMFAVEDFRDLN